MNRPKHLTTAPSDLQTLVNVGPAIARRFERVGITRTSQLAGRDPVALFELMCVADGRQDPCLLDTLMSAVEQADGGPARPWWEYSEKRRQLLSSTT